MKDANAAFAPKASTGAYVLSFQAERFYKARRFHWTICRAQSPDKLVSWGHAPTQEEAESAARHEVEDLSSGLSQGGRVMSAVQAYTRR
jgi:hypothetical protein